MRFLFYPILQLWRFVRRQNILRLVLVIVLLIVVGAAIVRELEKDINSQFHFFGDALWWAVVTIATVGYGDITPQTHLGRFAAGILIFSGMGLVSVLTATIASVLTARRIREGAGVQRVKAVGHIVVCGWNNNAEKVINGLIRAGGRRSPTIVLINELPEEEIGKILLKYADAGVEYISGDFVQEGVLRRANIQEASSAIVLADVCSGRQGKSDERTILATLAIKSIKPEVKVCAELMEAENVQHLRRANVDDIIVSGEYDGFLLASAAVSPGIPQTVREILTHDAGSELHRLPIPTSFIGRTFGELSSYFRREHQVILIGITSEEPGLPLEEMLSESSYIDLFIKQKFSEAGRDIIAEGRKQMEIRVNPEDGYQIQEGDYAIVIGRGTTG